MAVTSLNFAEWAHSASREFITNGTPMSTSITKVAQENELSPVQIQRICEIANHHAYSELFKTAEDKTFEFPLAKSEEIMALLQEEPEKIAADYVLDPVGEKREVDCNRVFGITDVGNECETDEAAKLTQSALSKVAAAREEIEGRLSVSANSIHGAEDAFYKTAKQMVLNGTALSDVHAACTSHWDSPLAGELMAKVAMQMAQEGVLGAKIEHLVKTSEAVDAKLISEKLHKNNPGVPTRIINGNHPIIAHINTLSDKYKDADNMERGLTVLDDKARMLRTRMKDLNSSKKVDQFIQSEAF